MGGFSVRSYGTHDGTDADPRSWEDADRLLHRKRGGARMESRRLSANTVLRRCGDGSIAVRLHDTDVVTWTADGWAVLTTGTWNTPTTRNRISRHLPDRCSVSVDKRVPYLRVGGWDDGRTVTFTDGMRMRVADPADLVVGDDVSLAPPRRPFGTFTFDVQRATGREWTVQAWHDEEYGEPAATRYSGAYGHAVEPTQRPDGESAARMGKGEPTGFTWL